MEQEKHMINSQSMHIDGYIFYSVKIITQEDSVKKNKGKLSKFEYYLKCRNIDTGDEVEACSTYLTKSMGYNDMDMFLTIQKSRVDPLIFVSTGKNGDGLSIDVYLFSDLKIEKLYQISRPDLMYGMSGPMIISHRNYLIVELYKDGFSDNIGLVKNPGKQSKFQEKKMIQNQLMDNNQESLVDVVVFKVNLIK